MNELVEFLRARLDEDELAARTALDFEYEIPQDAPWRVAQRHVENGAFTTWDGHIARHDPARVLAEVEAKRRIVDEHALMSRDIGWLDDDRNEAYGELEVCAVCVPKHSHFASRADVPTGSCRTVRLLALPYASHPAYREEWKP